jgi:NAD(P)-dependent dehydrogenase (short-subunit alcohol dehydrogenase family)
MQIEGASAIVTGAASGLGAATTAVLREAGAKVTGLDPAYSAGSSDNADLSIACDVTDEDAVDQALDTTTALHGPPRIIVNCAGISENMTVLGKDGSVMPLEQFRRVIDVHMAGTFNVCRLAANRIRALDPINDDGERGVIVNTSSIAGIDGATGSASYAAAKAGVAGLTLPLSREFSRYGIRVVAIAPGLFETPMALEALDDKIREKMLLRVPFPKRMGDPSDFGKLVKSICEISMFNGEVIRLDAGYRVSL